MTFKGLSKRSWSDETAKRKAVRIYQDIDTWTARGLQEEIPGAVLGKAAKENLSPTKRGRKKLQ